MNVSSAISNPLNSYRQAANGPAVSPPAAGPLSPDRESAPAVRADSTKASQSNQAADQTPRPSTDSKPPARTTTDSNVVLRFEVDEETHNVTVYMVDRQSKKVLRTIPPNEVTRLSPGDLLRLTA